MTTAWSQLEQLLTCAICLDRFRNPKLLPCNHTFCAEPCMDGLVDYARRQIKCPECRAEHRIPYNGIQTFPNNVTLSRFLDLHRNITGEEPEPVPSMMERCGICGEKSMVTKCAHCEKKVCEECKEAHLEILRREISRINNQVKRGVEKLNEHLQQAARNSEKLQQTHSQLKEEITETVRRFVKDLKDKEEKLLQELEEYTLEETRNLEKLKENLELETGNLNSNCELAEKHINENEEWTDAELVEYKEIFMKSLDFLRNFDPDSSDGRKIKFQTNGDIDMLRRSLLDFGELKITSPNTGMNPISPSGSSTNINSLSVPFGSQNALMRSQSDHRLAMQFQQRLRQNDPASRYLDLTSQRLSDSERETRTERGASDRYGSSRFGTEDRDSARNRFLRTDPEAYSPRNYGRTATTDEEPVTTSHFKSRFMRERERNAAGDLNAEDSHDSDYGHGRSVRFEETTAAQPKPKVFENEQAIKGPLSGVAKLTDSPFVMQRLHQNQVRQKLKEEEARNAPPPQPVQTAPAPVPYQPRRTPSRQVSEDEIEKQKKQNHIAAAAAAASPAPVPAAVVPPSPGTKVPDSPSRLLPKRVASLQQDERTPTSETPGRRRGSQENTIVESLIRDDEEEEDTSPIGRIAARNALRQQRSAAISDESASPASRQSSTPRSVRSPVGKNLSMTLDADTHSHSDASSTRSSPKASALTQKASIATEKSSVTSRSPVTDTESEDTSEESESESDAAVIRNPTGTSATNKYERSFELPSSVSTLLTRSALIRKESVDNSNRFASGSPVSGTSSSSRAPFTRSSTLTEEPSYRKKSITDYSSARKESDTNSSSGYHSRGSLTRAATYDEDPTPVRHVDSYSTSSSTPYSSRFLSNSRPSTTLATRDDTYGRSTATKYGSRASRDSATPGSTSSSYKSRLAKSKSSHTIGLDDSDEETPLSPSYRSKYSDTSSSFMPRTSRSGYVYRTRDSSPPTEDKTEDTQFGGNGVGGSSGGTWAQYLRNKYGSHKSGTGSSSSQSGSKDVPAKPIAKSRSSHAVYGRSISESSDEETAQPVIHRRSSKDIDTSSYSLTGSTFTRSMYLQKKKMMMRIGSRGAEPGHFTWPRSVSCGPDNNIVVADSSNHRVQVFDSTGRFQFEFGSYGSNEGEFDCLAGVVVNRIGQFIVSDRYNHRIQVFDPSGKFLRAFGSEGRSDGKFNYPWGIATDGLGFIYVCDKENHRIQVFQSDGTFVGKFGSIGSRTGLLEHPHYIAVTNSNRVVVSDTNNHRIQIFDVNGRSLTTFGTEGSEDGQFKFPRGLAVDDQGYIIVGDSGNNRIQIFTPDGTFLKGFGCWGASDGEFKGIEGVAVTSTGNILVCDRENHRVQIF